MTLYQTLPKQSIQSLLLRRFSQEDLLAARAEIDELLQTCQTMDELANKLSPVLRKKQTTASQYIGRKSVSDVIQRWYDRNSN